LQVYTVHDLPRRFTSIYGLTK